VEYSPTYVVVVLLYNVWLPKATLLEPLMLLSKAFGPRAMLLYPVVLEVKALLPIAMLLGIRLSC
jgi:hypothetical protein